MASNASTRAARDGPSGNGGRFDEAPADPRPAEAFQKAVAELGEIKEFASYLIAAKLDSYKVTVRTLAIYAVLGVVGAVAGCAVVAMAVVLLLHGVADGIGQLAAHLFGSEAWHWTGPVLVGLLIFVGLVVGVIFGLKRVTHTMHSRLVSKYEDRQRQQRINYGFDVEQRARQQRAAGE